MKSTYLILLIFCSLETFPQSPDSIQPLTINKLMNAIYSPSENESLFDKNIKLINGFHYYPNQYEIIDSTSYTDLNDKMVAFGDLNKDGIDDAAVILGTEGGGSGYFVDLVVVYNMNGNPRCIASKGLGDRIEVKQIKINKGIVELKMLTHMERDGQCCPSKITVAKFIVKGNKLVEITGVKFY